MLQLKNETLDSLVKNIIGEFQYINARERMLKKLGLEKIDIPFYISSLYQAFEGVNDEISADTEFADFVRTLQECDDYNIDVLKDSDGYLKVTIYPAVFHDCFYDNMKHYYTIKFFQEDRDYGCCECTPDMKDYREDKDCCGHGCDATFSGFKIEKTAYILYHTWDGDEHDYWNFEDEYYEEHQDDKAKKEQQNRECRIQFLKANIEMYSKELNELLEK